MNARQAVQARKAKEQAYREGFDAGVDATMENMVKSTYGAAALAVRRLFKPTQDQIVELLKEIDNIIINEFTSIAIVQKAWEELHIGINFDDGIDRFENLETEENDAEAVSDGAEH